MRAEGINTCQAEGRLAAYGQALHLAVRRKAVLEAGNQFDLASAPNWYSYGLRFRCFEYLSASDHAAFAGHSNVG
jgi:hypothetical protein